MLDRMIARFFDRLEIPPGLGGLTPLVKGPIEQFEIKTIVPIHIGGLDLSFTNASLFMVLSTLAAITLLTAPVSPRGLVPGRLQSVAEMTYEFIANMVRSTAGSDGLKYFPFIFSIFMFVLMANLLGMAPYAFTVTSHVAVTGALALMVILTVILIGFWKNGLGFLKLFVPSGVPWYVLWFVAILEVISFLSRPLSLSLRLFGNMLAGHMVMKVFAGFIISLAATGAVGGAVGILPFTGIVALTALEFLVAAVQAYIFAILTSIYLNDALHPSH